MGRGKGKGKLSFSKILDRIGYIDTDESIKLTLAPADSWNMPGIQRRIAKMRQKTELVIWVNQLKVDLVKHVVVNIFIV